MFKKRNKSRCPLCFSLCVRGTAYCPVCVRLRERAPMLDGRDPLPSGYRLSEDILLGSVIAASPHSLLYAAWNEKKKRRVFVREYFSVRQGRRDADNTTLQLDTPSVGTEKKPRKSICKNGMRYSLEKDNLKKILQPKKEKELLQRSPIIYQVAMHSIQGTRPRQEDSTVCLAGQGFAFAVLCDGMGGMGNGEIASGHTAARYYSLYPTFCNMPEEQIVPNLLHAAQCIDAEICALRSADGAPLGCGSTLVSVVIREDRVYILHLGDSRLYRIRDGKIEQLTKDHTLYYELLEEFARGELTRQELEAHPKKEALTQYIGSGQKITAQQLQPDRFAPQDTLLLCSDGVYRTLKEDRILALLSGSESAEIAVSRLLQAVQDENMPYQDNASAILIRRVHGGKA